MATEKFKFIFSPLKIIRYIFPVSIKKKIRSIYKEIYVSTKYYKNKIKQINSDYKKFRILNFKILFKSISEKQYNEIFNNNYYTSYLQSISYIKSYSKKFLLYQIEHSGKIIGRFAISNKKYYFLNIYIINRMNLKESFKLSKKIPSEYIYLQLINFIRHELKSGLLIILPLENIRINNPFLILLVRLFKFKPYKTGLINLNQSIENIKMNMKSRWRRQIKNGIKFNYKIKNSDKRDDIFKIIEIYKKEKIYEGIDTQTLKKWYQNSSNKDSKFIALSAFKNVNNIEESIGHLIFCINDSTATYLIGIFLNKKVNKYVSNILLWESIIYAKKYGCNYFDLGGIDSLNTPGIAHFKLGLNPMIHQDAYPHVTWV